MALLNRKRVILVKVESTYGTDPVPVVGTDALLVRDVQITPLQADYADRSLIRPYFGSSDQIPTTSQVALDIELELVGMKGLGVATPATGALLRACGLGETIVASTSVTYDPVSTGFESCTAYFNLDGVLHKVTGARGSASLSLKAQELPVIRVRLVGIFNAVTDTAAGTPVYTDFKTPVPCNSTNTTGLDIHGFTAGVLDTLDIDLANNIVFRSLVGGSDEVLLTDRAPSGSISIEATTVAAKAWFPTIQNATTGVLSVAHGPAGNRVTVSATKLQLTNPQFQDSDGVAMLQMGAQFIPSSGNDEISIAFD